MVADSTGCHEYGKPGIVCSDSLEIPHDAEATGFLPCDKSPIIAFSYLSSRADDGEEIPDSWRFVADDSAYRLQPWYVSTSVVSRSDFWEPNRVPVNPEFALDRQLREGAISRQYATTQYAAWLQSPDSLVYRNGCYGRELTR